MRIRDLYATPLPAATTAGLALSQMRPPARAQAGLFGSAFALGAWMMYDGDYHNGAGFTAVWSALYVLAQRRAVGRRLVPTVLASVAAANAVGYAIGFSHSGRARPPAPASPPPGPPGGLGAMLETPGASVPTQPPPGPARAPEISQNK